MAYSIYVGILYIYMIINLSEHRNQLVDLFYTVFPVTCSLCSVSEMTFSAIFTFFF